MWRTASERYDRARERTARRRTALTESLAAEWGRAGVRVNTVSPGFTHTPAVAKSFERGILNETKLAEATALGRLVDPSEIAAAVGFLASPLSSAITGVNLIVDAGYLVATAWQTYAGRSPGSSNA